jgi:hypothetical protein
MITADYSLIHEVERLADGADVHSVAQPLNSYVLSVRGLNESSDENERQVFDSIRQRSETALRIFIAKKRLTVYEKA